MNKSPDGISTDACCKMGGFTLVELMVAIAIVSILVSLAIPSYQNYTVRAKITEALQFVSPLKLLVSEYYLTNADLPADAAEAGIDTNITTNYLSGVEYTKDTDETCNIGFTLADSISNDLSGKKILFNCGASNGYITWNCSSDPDDIPPIDGKYLPSICR